MDRLSLVLRGALTVQMLLVDRKRLSEYPYCSTRNFVYWCGNKILNTTRNEK